MAKTGGVVDTMADYIAVRLDETYYYSIAAEDKPYITKIYGVYVYDPNEQTYCGELQPSYWLERVYDTIEFSDTLLALVESEQDLIIDRLSERYENCTEDTSMYMHCRTVDGLDSTNKKEYVDFETLEDMVEYIRGNCPF